VTNGNTDTTQNKDILNAFYSYNFAYPSMYPQQYPVNSQYNYGGVQQQQVTNPASWYFLNQLNTAQPQPALPNYDKQAQPQPNNKTN